MAHRRDVLCGTGLGEVGNGVLEAVTKAQIGRLGDPIAGAGMGSGLVGPQTGPWWHIPSGVISLENRSFAIAVLEARRSHARQRRGLAAAAGEDVAPRLPEKVGACHRLSKKRSRARVVS